MKAAGTESPSYIIRLYEFLEQKNLLYNSGKQIRPAGGGRKLTSKGHEETVQGHGNALSRVCVADISAVSIGRSTQYSFSIKKEKAHFPDSATGKERQ